MEQLILIAGGICLFLYGMNLSKEGLQHASGERLRKYIFNYTRNAWRALLLGTVVTMALQSSTAATVMLIGFTNIGLVELANALAVAIGASIGSSLFVLIISKLLFFPIHGFAVFLMMVGIGAMQFGKKRASNLGKIFLGFGMLLFGLKLVASMGQWLTDHPMLLDQLIGMGSRPIPTLMVGLVLTVIMQSSTATLGILLSLSLTGSIPIRTAVMMVVGANIGTTSAVLLASLQGSENGKRMALGQLGFKLVGAALVIFFLEPICQILVTQYDSLTEQIAISHLVFNFGLALLFTPWTRQIARLLERLVPKEILGDDQFQVKYLDKSVLETPTLAIGNVVREVIRMANITQDMFTQFWEALEGNRPEILERLEGVDDQVDILNREIKFYLAQISQGALTPEQAKSQLELLSLTTNLEEIGDIINRNLCSLAQKKNRKHVTFSQEGWRDLRQFHGLILENFNLSISAFSTRNLEIGRKVARHKKKIMTIYEEMQQGHLGRLQEGLKESFATSSLHMELLSSMLRVNVLICKMVNPIVETNNGSSD